MTFQFIDAHRHQWPVRLLCRTLPIEPPPLDDPPRTALALQQGGNRQHRSQDEPFDFTDAERHAMKIRLLAADITELLFECGAEVRQGKNLPGRTCGSR